MDPWTLVGNFMPEPHKRYRVFRPDHGQEFVATPCYGMHAPWWVPRNGFTREESEPIEMHEDDEWTEAREGD